MVRLGLADEYDDFRGPFVPLRPDCGKGGR